MAGESKKQICRNCGKIFRYKVWNIPSSYHRLFCGEFCYLTFGISEESTIQEPPQIKKGSCCAILRSHAELLKDDKERLSTNFIKTLSKCGCEDDVR